MTEEALIDLLKQMTLEEKVAQMLQLPPSFFDESGEITGPMNELGIDQATVESAGSTLGIMGAKRLKSIQKEYLAKSRLKIPLLFMHDVIHGLRTGFPIPLAMGASWNLELARESARIAAYESAVSGIHLTFSPMVDLVRDARWGRVMESTGEDGYLNGAFAKAFVEGYQGKALEKYRIAACVKHFAAYGAAEAGRDYNTVDMSRWMLREYYLPAYKVAIDAGAKMVMSAFNTIDGVPATVNEWLMKDLLREEWGFDGLLISDWGALWESVVHGQCQDKKEAAHRAMQATLDIEMCSGCYPQHLTSLVSEGKIKEEQIDRAVLRILTLKNELGLFENPYRDADEALESTVLLSAEHRKVSLEQAEESIVLLKNDRQILPLHSSQAIALIGPKATTHDLVGAWNCGVLPEEAVTIEAGMRALFPKFEAMDGVSWADELDMVGAVAMASRADVVVLALGEDASMSGEAKSRTAIGLSDAQLKLIAAVKATGKPIVAMISTGRPLDLSAIIDDVDALLITWFLGSEAGNAIARTLIGKNNPSGKLPMSFPRSVGQLPLYYNAFKTGRPSEDQFEIYRSNYIDERISALYPFGYGIGYSPFHYSDITLSSNTLNKNSSITARVTVTNQGKHRGKEVVQLYLTDLFGRVVRPMKELKGFVKIELEAGMSQELTFEISEAMLRFYDNRGRYASEAGDFTLFIGTSSADDARKVTFSLSE